MKLSKNKEANNLLIDTPVNTQYPVKVKDIRTARRLMSRIILQFQQGKISSLEAKTITYLLQNFVSICREAREEQREEQLLSIFSDNRLINVPKSDEEIKAMDNFLDVLNKQGKKENEN
ncbi:MAG: hypothetical protein V1779_11580 [bacterium]